PVKIQKCIIRDITVSIAIAIPGTAGPGTIAFIISAAAPTGLASSDAVQSFIHFPQSAKGSPMTMLSARAALSPIFASVVALTLTSLAPNAHAKNAIGLGVGVVPEYEGSGDYRALPVPLINYERGNFFISPRAGLPS